MSLIPIRREYAQDARQKYKPKPALANFSDAVEAALALSK